MTEVLTKAPTTPRTKGGKVSSATIHRIISWSSPVAVLLVWEILAQTGYIPKKILPAPSTVFVTGWNLTVSGVLPEHLGISILRAAGGLAIGCILGLILGIIASFSRLGDALIDRNMQMMRAIPFYALLPLVIIWFGVGEGGKLFLVAKAVIFPIYLNTVLGIRQVDPKLLEMAKVAQLSRAQIIYDVILPGAMPSILSGFRIALGVAWLALIVAETLGARSGLGYLAIDAREFLRTDVIVLTIFIYAVIGIVSDVIARALEAKILAWHPNYANRTS